MKRRKSPLTREVMFWRQKKKKKKCLLIIAVLSTVVYSTINIIAYYHCCTTTVHRTFPLREPKMQHDVPRKRIALFFFCPLGHSFILKRVSGDGGDFQQMVEEKRNRLFVCFVCSASAIMLKYEHCLSLSFAALCLPLESQLFRFATADTPMLGSIGQSRPLLPFYP